MCRSDRLPTLLQFLSITYNSHIGFLYYKLFTFTIVMDFHDIVKSKNSLKIN